MLNLIISFYVQGINDLVTPFLVVFLNDHFNIDIETFEVPNGLENIDQETLLQVKSKYSLLLNLI